MSELNQTINYVTLFGLGLCILALMALCIAWVFGFIRHYLELKFQNMNHISKFLGHMAFAVLAICALTVVVSCTIWMVQSILREIW